MSTVYYPIIDNPPSPYPKVALLAIRNVKRLEYLKEETMSQNATPLKLEDVAELERYLITKHKRSRIDVSLSILYAVAENKNEAMTDQWASLEFVTNGRLDFVYVQDYFKSFL